MSGIADHYVDALNNINPNILIDHKDKNKKLKNAKEERRTKKKNTHNVNNSNRDREYMHDRRTVISSENLDESSDENSPHSHAAITRKDKHDVQSWEALDVNNKKPKVYSEDNFSVYDGRNRVQSNIPAHFNAQQKQSLGNNIENGLQRNHVADSINIKSTEPPEILNKDNILNEGKLYRQSVTNNIVEDMEDNTQRNITTERIATTTSTTTSKPMIRRVQSKEILVVNDASKFSEISESNNTSHNHGSRASIPQAVDDDGERILEVESRKEHQSNKKIIPIEYEFTHDNTTTGTGKWSSTAMSMDSLMSVGNNNNNNNNESIVIEDLAHEPLPLNDSNTCAVEEWNSKKIAIKDDTAIINDKTPQISSYSKDDSPRLSSHTPQNAMEPAKIDVNTTNSPKFDSQRKTNNNKASGDSEMKSMSHLSESKFAKPYPINTKNSSSFAKTDNNSNYYYGASNKSSSSRHQWNTEASMKEHMDLFERSYTRDDNNDGDSNLDMSADDRVLDTSVADVEEFQSYESPVKSRSSSKVEAKEDANKIKLHPKTNQDMVLESPDVSIDLGKSSPGSATREIALKSDVVSYIQSQNRRNSKDRLVSSESYDNIVDIIRDSVESSSSPAGRSDNDAVLHGTYGRYVLESDVSMDDNLHSLSESGEVMFRTTDKTNTNNSNGYDDESSINLGENSESDIGISLYNQIKNNVLQDYALSESSQLQMGEDSESALFSGLVLKPKSPPVIGNKVHESNDIDNFDANSTVMSSQVSTMVAQIDNKIISGDINPIVWTKGRASLDLIETANALDILVSALRLDIKIQFAKVVSIIKL
jgi:hypothetical protein